MLLFAVLGDLALLPVLAPLTDGCYHCVSAVLGGDSRSLIAVAGTVALRCCCCFRCAMMLLLPLGGQGEPGTNETYTALCTSSAW